MRQYLVELVAVGTLVGLDQSPVRMLAFSALFSAFCQVE